MRKSEPKSSRSVSSASGTVVCLSDRVTLPAISGETRMLYGVFTPNCRKTCAAGALLTDRSKRGSKPRGAGAALAAYTGVTVGAAPGAATGARGAGRAWGAGAGAAAGTAVEAEA